MDFDDDEGETWPSADYGPVVTWDEALNLLDQVTEYWVTFYPVVIHPDFYDRFLSDAERRAANLSQSAYERWKKVCLPRWSDLRGSIR